MIPKIQASQALETAAAIGTVLFGTPEAVGDLVERATGSPETGRIAEHAAKKNRMMAQRT